MTYFLEWLSRNTRGEAMGFAIWFTISLTILIPICILSAIGIMVTIGVLGWR